MNARDKPRQDWTVVLRRQPVRMVDGHPDRGYTSMFEIIRCDYGDPGLGYCEVRPGFSRIRGPYPITLGVEAYVDHVERHPSGPAIHASGSCELRDFRAGSVKSRRSAE